MNATRTVNGLSPENLYTLIAGESSETIRRLTPHIAAISDEMADDIAEWLSTLPDDADVDAVRAIVSPGVLGVRCDEDSYDDDRQGSILYRTATYYLTLDGDDTPVSWERSAAGYVSHGGREMAGTTVCEEAEGSERAPEWVRKLVDDVDQYPGISDKEINETEEEANEEEYGAEPEEDAEGEWAVIGMDGNEHGRYATEAECHAAISHETARFSASPHSSGGAYLPRSVCHLPCGVVRCGQWSTSYYSPNCTHKSDAE